MEFLVIILIIILLVLVLKLSNKVGVIDSKMDLFFHRLEKLEMQQKAAPIEKETSKLKEEVKPKEEIKPVAPTPPVVKKEEKAKEKVEKPDEPIIMGTAEEFLKSPVKGEEKKSEDKAPESTPKPKVAAFSDTQSKVTPERTAAFVPPKPKQRFMDKYPDLERFIGENLLNKIGIVIFVIGMGFLVKLGIDNDIITEPMRLAIGILVGGAMVGIAHYLRKSFTTFSSILIGGALSVMYYTIGVAFHEYEILSQEVSFVVMVMITLFGVLLSLSYDRKELAILAMLGGFGTPFFLSTGSGNFQVLFTYMIILDLGMLALVYFKKWMSINYLVFGLTYILYAAVFADKFIGNEEATRWPMFWFLTTFYVIFFLMTIVYNIRKKVPFNQLEFGLLLTNTALYFGMGLKLLYDYEDGMYNGTFTACLAILNLIFAVVLFRRKGTDSNLLYLLIGLVLTFISLIAPIQLDGNQITLFWACEAVLLLWLSGKADIKLMRLAAVAVNLAMIISLLMDWGQLYYVSGYEIDPAPVLPIIFNKAWITSLFVFASLGASRLVLNQYKEETLVGIPVTQWKATFSIGFVIITYFSFLLELNYQLLQTDWASSLQSLIIGVYNYFLLTCVLVFGRKNASAKILQVLNGAVFVAIAAYMTYYLGMTLEARKLVLYHIEGGISAFRTHYVLLGFVIYFLVYAYRYIKKYLGLNSGKGKIAVWAILFMAVYVISWEAIHVGVMTHYVDGGLIKTSTRFALKSILPGLWAVTALVLMVFGMRKKIKTFRLFSLVLFSVTILKLFLFDLQGNATGKIISFTVLGAILLAVSFLYQKLKFIIEDDEQQTKEADEKVG